MPVRKQKGKPGHCCAATHRLHSPGCAGTHWRQKTLRESARKQGANESKKGRRCLGLIATPIAMPSTVRRPIASAQQESSRSSTVPPDMHRTRYRTGSREHTLRQTCACALLNQETKKANGLVAWRPAMLQRLATAGCSQGHEDGAAELDCGHLEHAELVSRKRCATKLVRQQAHRLLRREAVQ
jgi:hypothetical protein